MADIINFKDAKKDSVNDKLKIIKAAFIREHKFLNKNIDNMLVFEGVKIEDKSNSQEYIISITKGPLLCMKIHLAKSKMKYKVIYTECQELESAKEITIMYEREITGAYEVSKKIKKIEAQRKFILWKYSKALYDSKGNVDARIIYNRDFKKTYLYQENSGYGRDKFLVHMYIYNNKLDLITSLRGFRCIKPKKENAQEYYNSYVLFDGYYLETRVPDDKCLKCRGLKDIVKNNFTLDVRPARTSNLEVITNSDIDMLNNRNKVLSALKLFESKIDDKQNIIDKFQMLKKYKNEYDEEMVFIKTSENVIYKYTKKMSSIFEIQAEKYKCFYENDFLNPNSIVTEVEALTYPLVAISDIEISKKDNDNIIYEKVEKYEDDFLLLKREKTEKDGIRDNKKVILDSIWSLDTNDIYKKQKFKKNAKQKLGYDEYDYICIPEDDKIGFRFLTREDYTESLKEVFVFGKINDEGIFKNVNSVYLRKNSPYDAIILRSVDKEEMNPSNVLMDYGKVATSELLDYGIDTFEYNYTNSQEESDNEDERKILVDVNKLEDFLDRIEDIEKIMLKDIDKGLLTK